MRNFSLCLIVAAVSSTACGLNNLSTVKDTGATSGGSTAAPATPTGPIGVIAGGFVTASGPSGGLPNMSMALASTTPGTPFPAGPNAAALAFPPRAQLVMGNGGSYLNHLSMFSDAFPSRNLKGFQWPLYTTDLSLVQGTGSGEGVAVYAGQGVTVYVAAKANGAVDTQVKIWGPKQLANATGIEAANTYNEFTGKGIVGGPKSKGARVSEIKVVRNPSTAQAQVEPYTPPAATKATTAESSALDKLGQRGTAADSSIKSMQASALRPVDVVLAQLSKFEGSLKNNGAATSASDVSSGLTALADAASVCKRMAQESGSNSGPEAVERADRLLDSIRELDRSLMRADKDARGTNYRAKTSALALQKSARVETLPELVREVSELAREVAEIAEQTAADR